MDRERVVRLRVPSKTKFGVMRFGTGYLVGGGLVLTTKHTLVAPGTELEVPVCELLRPMDRDTTSEWESARVVWRSSFYDAALVHVPLEAWALPSVRWGRMGGTAIVEWEAVGYPRAGREAERTEEHVWGHTSPITQATGGGLGLTIASRRPSFQSDDSSWSGLSGAAVLVDDRLVGLITQDPLEWSRSLTGIRIEAFADDPGFASALGYRPIVEPLHGAPQPIRAQSALDLGRAAIRTTVVPDQLWHPFVAHPYVLEPRGGFVGRDDERGDLVAWLTDEPSETRVRLLVGIGGSGKSALAWETVRTIKDSSDTNQSGPLIWWSFYDESGSFDQFIARLSEYLLPTTVADLTAVEPSRRIDLILEVLADVPAVLYLDGVERLLIGYGRDFATMSETLSDLQLFGSNADTPESVRDMRSQSKEMEPRVSRFLRRLTALARTRTVVTTRLVPVAFMDPWIPEPLDHVQIHYIRALTGDEGLSVWKSMGLSVEATRLSPILKLVDNHPLVIRALAGQVLADRVSTGDIEQQLLDAIRDDQSTGEDPIRRAVRAALGNALRALNPSEWKVLSALAAIRTPPDFSTLADVLTTRFHAGALDLIIEDEDSLRAVLIDLEERGLVGWDRGENRYDLHPMVRGLVWALNSHAERETVLNALIAGYALVHIFDAPNPTSLAQIAPSLQMFEMLLEIDAIEEALTFFFESLSLRLASLLAYERTLLMLTELSEHIEGQDIDIDDEVRAAIHSVTGAGRLMCGHVKESIPEFAEATRLSRRSEFYPESPWMVLSAETSRITRAWAYALLLDLDQAWKLLNEAPEHTHPVVQAMTEMTQSALYIVGGDFGRAVECSRASQETVDSYIAARFPSGMVYQICGMLRSVAGHLGPIAESLASTGKWATGRPIASEIFSPLLQSGVDVASRLGSLGSAIGKARVGGARLRELALELQMAFSELSAGEYESALLHVREVLESPDGCPPLLRVDALVIAATLYSEVGDQADADTLLHDAELLCSRKSSLALYLPALRSIKELKLGYGVGSDDVIIERGGQREDSLLHRLWRRMKQ